MEITKTKVTIFFAKNLESSYKNYIKTNICDFDSKYIFNYLEEKNAVQDYLTIAKKIEINEINRAIIIDEYGSLPFMIMAKNKKNIVAQISDYHSARMTIQHNNSNVLALSYKCISKENMISIINVYLNAQFEGGRHMIRINMLDILLEDN